MSSFFALGLGGHLGDDNRLLKLERLLDWSLFSPILSDIHSADGHSADGPTGYDPVQMFKCILLGELIPKTRWRIEQCLGTIKHRFDFQRTDYFRTKKVDAQFKTKAMCANLLKAINKVQML